MMTCRLVLQACRALSAVRVPFHCIPSHAVPTKASVPTHTTTPYPPCLSQFWLRSTLRSLNLCWEGLLVPATGESVLARHGIRSGPRLLLRGCQPRLCLARQPLPSVPSEGGKARRAKACNAALSYAHITDSCSFPATVPPSLPTSPPPPPSLPGCPLHRCRWLAC